MQQSLQRDVTALIGKFAARSPELVDIEADLHSDLGIASLDLVLMREDIEREFGVSIADEEVELLVSGSSIIDLIVEKRAGGVEQSSPHFAAPQQNNSPHLTAGSHLAHNLLYTDLEIGMPLTGRNNLAETPLLREIGHLRWQHMSAISGVASRDVTDADGDRLYPTFFYLELAFPSDRPMATFRENDRFTVVSSLRRYGRSMLDGEHFLFPAHDPEEMKRPPSSLEEGLRAGVPFLRLSNSFVKQWQGAGWLKKSRPADPGFERIPDSAEPPSTHAEAKRAEEEGGFFEVPEAYVPLTPGPVEFEYAIVPDRDLNGAGLLYFANYPMILDIAERQVLAGAGLESDLIDLRTLVHRKAAYFSNASADERLKVSVEAWIHNPSLTGEDPEIAPIRLLLNYKMERGSDSRLMLISSAKKVVLGRTAEETAIFDNLPSPAGS